MSHVIWVKVSSDIFQHRKINQIRKLPEGDSLALIWMQLLCLAGNTNDTGLVYFAENVPYTSEMLSVELQHPVQRIETALEVFQKFRMIDLQNNVISILNWERYQSSEKLQIIREYNRVKKQEQRKKQRERSEKVNGKVSGTIHGSQDTELDLDLDLDKEKDKEKKKDKTKIVNLNSRAKNIPDVPDADDHRGELLELYSELPGIISIH